MLNDFDKNDLIVPEYEDTTTVQVGQPGAPPGGVMSNNIEVKPRVTLAGSASLTKS
eukprot:SAG11_NODE_53_length_19648_cov_14.691902_7_plen_56_part_00